MTDRHGRVIVSLEGVLATAEFWEGRCLDCAHPQHEMTCHELVPNGDPSNGPAYCPCAVQIDWMEQEIVRQREAIEPLLALVRAAERVITARRQSVAVRDPDFWLRLDDFESALAALPESVRVAARKPE